jgi:hypothetical protein
MWCRADIDDFQFTAATIEYILVFNVLQLQCICIGGGGT